jgi:hypothetical protein
MFRFALTETVNNQVYLLGPIHAVIPPKATMSFTELLNARAPFCTSGSASCEHVCHRQKPPPH